MSATNYNIDDEVYLKKDREGIIRYKGPLDGKNGTYYGIEVTVGDGKHSGKYKDRRYFKCPKRKGLFCEGKNILSKKNSKPKKSKKVKKKRKSNDDFGFVDDDPPAPSTDKPKKKKKKKPKPADNTPINYDDISFLDDEPEPDLDLVIDHKPKKKAKKDKKGKKKKVQKSDKKAVNDAKKKKKKTKTNKSVMELAADAAWGSSTDEDEDDTKVDKLDKSVSNSKNVDNQPNIKPKVKTKAKVKVKKKAKGKAKQKVKKLVHITPSMHILNKKLKKKFTTKIDVIDGIYVVNAKKLYKMNSLKITETGKLLCNPWDNIVNKKGGVIRIQCQTEIIIEKDGIISASARGWYDKYGYGQGEKLKHYDIYGGASYGTEGIDYYDDNTKQTLHRGKMYGSNELIQLYPGGGNKFLRGGGIIELVAPLITNNGNIVCDGMGGCTGGSIFICCKTFINTKDGKIYAKGGNKTSFCGKAGNGRIAIYCDQFDNKGIILPKPYQHKIIVKKPIDKSKLKSKLKSKKKKRQRINIKKFKNNKKDNDPTTTDVKIDDPQTAIKTDADLDDLKPDNPPTDVKTDVKDDNDNVTNDVKDDTPSTPIYDCGLQIVENRETIKMNLVYDNKKNKKKFTFNKEQKVNDDEMRKEKEMKKAIDNIVNMLLKHEDKITNALKEVFEPLKVTKEIQDLLSTEKGFDAMDKHRKLYIKTKFRDRMIIDRLVTELKFVRLLGSISFMEFSIINRSADDIFDSNVMATMRYTNGRSEPFEEILPRIRWRLSYAYLDKLGKIKKQKSDFKFREKSLESKIVLWEFGAGREIQNYEILIKVDRTNDKYQSVLKNMLYAQQKAINISSHYQLPSDKLRRCGFLKIEKKAKLYPKEWYSDTKQGGIITIECIDLVNFGVIDTTSKGKYGKYGKGAGQLRKDKKKKNPKRKVNKSNDNEDYYFGAKYNGKQKLIQLVHGCGIVGRKYLKGGGSIDLYIKDHFINYGVLSCNGSLSSSGGSIFICCKIFINYGNIQCSGGKEISEKSGNGENGRIAIYTNVFENYGKVEPQSNVYIGSFEEGKQIFLKRNIS